LDGSDFCENPNLLSINKPNPSNSNKNAFFIAIVRSCFLIYDVKTRIGFNQFEN